MLQALLADRFQTGVPPPDERAFDIRVTVGKNGPKLHESTGEGESVTKETTSIWRSEKTTMAQFAEMLSSPLHTLSRTRPASRGAFDFSLDLAPSFPDECHDAPCGLGDNRPAEINCQIQREIEAPLEPVCP